MISNYPSIQFNNSKPVQKLYKLNYDNQYDINSIKRAKSFNVDDISKISLKNNSNIINNNNIISNNNIMAQKKEEVSSPISSLDYLNYQNLNSNNNIGTGPYYNVYSIKSNYSNKTNFENLSGVDNYENHENNKSLYDPVKDPTSSHIRSSLTTYI